MFHFLFMEDAANNSINDSTPPTNNSSSTSDQALLSNTVIIITATVVMVAATLITLSSIAALALIVRVKAKQKGKQKSSSRSSAEQENAVKDQVSSNTFALQVNPSYHNHNKMAQDRGNNLNKSNQNPQLDYESIVLHGNEVCRSSNNDIQLQNNKSYGHHLQEESQDYENWTDNAWTKKKFTLVYVLYSYLPLFGAHM